MGLKTHKAAAVLIPPQEVWPAIQDIRRLHDRQYRRWMPHVMLLYPFHRYDQFDRLAGPLGEACRAVEPFGVNLEYVRCFAHGSGSYTIFLAPEPAEPLKRLQEVLISVVPDCDDVRRYAGGFTPHLSLGQARDRHELKALLRALQASWREVAFQAQAVSLIWRRSPPYDIFRVDRTIPLGAHAD
jgi:2'-5' RNA ligase